MVKINKQGPPWIIQVRFRWPDGTVYRERRRATVTGKDAARREGERREAHLLAAGKAALAPAAASPLPPPVPALAEFAPRWIDGYARARRQKASSIDSKRVILRVHLLPAFGDLRLDEITDERVALFQGGLTCSRKTANNVSATLSVMLKTAVTWKVIPSMPCTIALFKVATDPAAFLEFADYETLVDAAGKIDTRALAVVLLGGTPVYGAARSWRFAGATSISDATT